MRSARFVALATGALLCVGGRSAPTIDAYHPRPVAPPSGGYITGNGAVRIVGYNDMREIIGRWNDLFSATHPGIKFEPILKGTATAAPALAFGVSAFAPMGADFSTLEMENYVAVTGTRPLAFRVAHATAKHGALSGPVHVFVNARNPLRSITLSQICQIFCASCSDGTITRWRQLGLDLDWANREVHPVTIGDEAPSGGGPFLERLLFQGRPFRLDGNRHAGSAANLELVANDRLAIGLATDNVLDARVKVLSVLSEKGAPVSLSDATIANGEYPLSRDLLIYVRTQQRDPFVSEYLRLVLSREGQAAVAASVPGYIPLTAEEDAAELEKLR